MRLLSEKKERGRGGAVGERVRKGEVKKRWKRWYSVVRRRVKMKTSAKKKVCGVKKKTKLRK